MRHSQQIERAFDFAAERYAQYGVNVRPALDRLAKIAISLHCWQGDDVGGFEHLGTPLGGGLAVTGDYPGRARSPDELRSDIEKALSLIPGRHRVSLHASYGEFGRRQVERNAIAPEHFQNWISWAKARGLGLDFNPTFFAHPLARDGFTLAHRDRTIRRYWIEHGIRSREIGSAIGKKLGKRCVTNFWIPDGFKDTPADRFAPRERLLDSLDAIFKKRIDAKFNVDALEPKLFGIGSESYVAGSHEFYMGYAVQRQKWLCLDAGHYHPAESIADKIPALLPFVPGLLLHLSRGVRWDSDHVVTWSDDLRATVREAVRADRFDRVVLGMDYFDATINRVAAWVIGMRNVLRAVLFALLEPVELLRGAEAEGDYTTRLALQEELKAFPFGAVWDFYCERNAVPVGVSWLRDVKRYEREVLAKRT